MMLPFRACDIPGALASGFLILAACEAGYDGSWLIDQDWNPDRISRYGAVAFCIGLLVAAISRRVIEDKFVAAWLRRPEEFLPGGNMVGQRSWRRVLFPRYYAPLAEETRNQVASATGTGVTDDRISFHLYTTCRTLCLGFLIVSAILASGIVWHSVVSGWGQAEWRKLGYCILSLFEATGMLYRYLKYFRQHAIQVLIGKAEIE